MNKRDVTRLMITMVMFASCTKCNDQSASQPASSSAGAANTEKVSSTMEAISAAKNDGKLVMEDIVVGTGDEALADHVVSVHYAGRLEDGTQFDSSIDRNMPFKFKLGAGSVIKGWDDGIQGMKVGGKRKLVIPPRLGYGSEPQGGIIPANSVLIFDVELLEVQ